MPGFLRLIILTLFLALLTACGSGTGTGIQLNSNGSNTGTSAQHFVIVVLENQDYSDVVGSASMPYWNQLAQKNSLATAFYASAHPSIGNYFMMTTGQLISIDDNFSGTVSDDNVVRELNNGGKTWKVYAQSLPSTGYTGGDQYPYVRHHNPFTFFSDVLNSTTQAANIVSLTQFSSDVSSNSLPNYSFVVPDDQHNGHDCPNQAASCPLSDKLTMADNFLSTSVAPLLNNSTLMANTIVVITFDESASDLTNGGGHIPVIVMGGPIKTAYQSTTTYEFPSLLRFSLQSLGLSNYPGAATVATPMTEFLK